MEIQSGRLGQPTSPSDYWASNPFLSPCQPFWGREFWEQRGFTGWLTPFKRFFSILGVMAVEGWRRFAHIIYVTSASIPDPVSPQSSRVESLQDKKKWSHSPRQCLWLNSSFLEKQGQIWGRLFIWESFLLCTSHPSAALESKEVFPR